MEWKTVFDVAQVSPWQDWLEVVVIMPLVMFTVFLIAWFKPTSLGNQRHKQVRTQPKIVLLLGVPIIFIVVVVIFSCYIAHCDSLNYLQSNIRAGTCKEVQGKITAFDPMPSTGHKLESFEVNGVRFKYSDFDLTNPGFHNTTSHGGPVKDGLPVRIWYMPSGSRSSEGTNWIARLDVGAQN